MGRNYIGMPRDFVNKEYVVKGNGVFLLLLLELNMLL